MTHISIYYFLVIGIRNLKRIWMQALSVMQYVLSFKQEIPQIKAAIVMVEVLMETAQVALLHTRNLTLALMISQPIKQS